MTETTGQIEYADLPEVERAIVELLAAAHGRLAYQDIVTLVEEETEYKVEGANSAADRMRKKGLIKNGYDLTDPRYTYWTLTDKARQWVRDGEVESR